MRPWPKQLAQMTGEIERRLLVNYAVDPDVLRRHLPGALRPQLVDGRGVAGICLIRLGSLRPAWAPRRLGLTTENAAHRIAVIWDGPDGPEPGVYIPRRDSDSRLTVLLGGRVFPGAHSRAVFDVAETADDLQVAFRAQDGGAQVDVRVSVERSLEGSDLFADVDAASRFFEQASAGFSPSRDRSRLEGVRLATDAWRVDAGRVVHVRSSFFDDVTAFPAGSAQIDSALVMRKVPVVWDGLPSMVTAAS